MIFRKKNLKHQVKKFDKLITTLIIGGAIASIFGMSKTKKGKKLTEKIGSGIRVIFKKGFSFTGKTVVTIVKFLSKK